MNTEDIFKAVAQSFLVSIEAHINKLLDQKLEEFKSQLPESSETVSDVEFNKRMQVWLENNCIAEYVDADQLNLDTAIDEWVGRFLDVSREVDDYLSHNLDVSNHVDDYLSHNLDVSDHVKEYLADNFDIKEKISDALGNISWCLSIN
jgi:hypothetical protein